MNATARGATGEDSRGQARSKGAAGTIPPRLWAAIVAAALLGGLLLIIAEFSTLYEVKAVTATLKTQSGHAQHSFGLLVLGLAAIVMTFGMARGRTRPAMAAVAAIGVIALLIALAGALDDVNATGDYGERFASASTSPKAGFYLETLGAVLLLVAGGSALLLTAPGRPAREPRRRTTAGEAAAPPEDEEEQPEQEEPEQEEPEEKAEDEPETETAPATAEDDELDLEWEDVPRRSRAGDEEEEGEQPFTEEEQPTRRSNAAQRWLRNTVGRPGRRNR